jgi:hypothetical protein
MSWRGAMWKPMCWFMVGGTAAISAFLLTSWSVGIWVWSICAIASLACALLYDGSQ